MACCYARAGEPERALKILDKIVEGGWSHWDWLRHDGDLDALRDEPRFQDLLRQGGASAAGRASTTQDPHHSTGG